MRVRRGGAPQADPLADPAPTGWSRGHSASCGDELLVRLGVRSGKGRVETELFAEHALRQPSPQTSISPPDDLPFRLEMV